MPPAAPLDPFPWLDVAIIMFLVALNGVFNGQIRKRTPFKRIYVQPAANDGWRG